MRNHYYSIEELLSKIKEEPLKFIHELELDYIVNLINGYKNCASITNTLTKKDLYFKEFFDQWIRDWIIEEKGRDSDDLLLVWYKIIEKNTVASESAVIKFFELCTDFFLHYDEREIPEHSNIVKSSLYLSINELIGYIKRRYGMFITENSVSAIYYYLSGYYMCASNVEIATNEDVYFHLEFYDYVLDWVNSNFNTNYESKHRTWFRIIEKYTNTQEEAVVKFFELCELFFESIAQDGKIPEQTAIDI